MGTNANKKGTTGWVKTPRGPGVKKAVEKKKAPRKGGWIWGKDLKVPPET